VDKKGRVNFAQTELLIHVVNRETNRILDVERYVSQHCSEPMGSLTDIKRPKHSSLPRVIQMIDENKEQLRNLFRNYNVLDVQPAITAHAPDDLSALQVKAHLELELATLNPERSCPPLTVGGCLCWGAGSAPEVAATPLSLPDGDHRAGCPALPGCHALHPHELVLPHSGSRTQLALPCASCSFQTSF